MGKKPGCGEKTSEAPEEYVKIIPFGGELAGAKGSFLFVRPF